MQRELLHMLPLASHIDSEPESPVEVQVPRLGLTLQDGDHSCQEGYMTDSANSMIQDV